MIQKLLQVSKAYSKKLGIDLESRRREEIFKWFLASLLFGARISERIAMHTYEEFKRRGLLGARKLTRAGWNRLVDALDSGGYVRYDFKTASKLLEIMERLTKDYGGDLNKLYYSSSSQQEIEERLKNLGKGIGPITINIFLRELREIWKVEPLPLEFVIIAARNLGITKSENSKEVLRDLKRFWKGNKIRGKSFIDFEAALLKLGKDFCMKERCKHCILSRKCKKAL
jgi:endonuclease III